MFRLYETNPAFVFIFTQVDLVGGMYYPMFKDWYDVLGWKQLKIVRLEKYQLNTTAVTSDIFKFLELRKYILIG